LIKSKVRKKRVFSDVLNQSFCMLQAIYNQLYAAGCLVPVKLAVDIHSEWFPRCLSEPSSSEDRCRSLVYFTMLIHDNAWTGYRKLPSFRFLAITKSFISRILMWTKGRSIFCGSRRQLFLIFFSSGTYYICWSFFFSRDERVLLARCTICKRKREEFRMTKLKRGLDLMIEFSGPLYNLLQHFTNHYIWLDTSTCDNTTLIHYFLSRTELNYWCRAEQSSRLLSATSQHGHSWHRAPLRPVAIYLFSVKSFVFFFFRCSSSDKKGGVLLFYNWCSLTTPFPPEITLK
jgi:hypothetical protein